MAQDNELYFKIVVDNKAANKEVQSFKTNIQGLGKVNLTTSQNALKQINASMGETSKFAQTVKTAFDELAKGSPALRYALYDIRSSMLGISAAAAAFALTPIGFSIKYERSFANVIRTNQLGADSFSDLREQLRQDLLAIAQTTPISWEDVTNIATLAGQLGIAQQDISNFTETVAKFAATTDLTVDAAATAFGRLDQLIDDVDGQFENLGSAILAVGVDSVATESQIVNVSREIAAMGNLVGLTAPEIVGLAGALASLGVRPELARGTITRLFSNIGDAAASGGFKLAEFGRLTGRTADEFVSAWETDPGAVLQDFFDGINSEGPRAQRTLEAIGITADRDVPAILRLAQSSDEVRRLISLSRDEFLFATKVNEQYGIISGTTAEQIARLGQNVQTLGAAIGDSVNPLSALFQFLNLIVQGLTRIVSTPVGQFFSGLAIIVAAVVSGVTALLAVLAGVAASFLAAQFAAQKLGFSLLDVVKGALGSKTALDALAVSGNAAAVGMTRVAAALRLAFITSGVLAVLGLISGALAFFGNEVDATEDKVNKLFGGMDNLRKAIDADTAAFNNINGKMIDGSDAILTYTRSYKEATDAVTGQVEAAEEFIDAQGQIVTAVDEASDAIRKQTRAIDENTVEFFAGAFLQNPDLVNLFADPAFQQIFTEQGSSITEFIIAGIQGNSDQLVDELVATQKSALQEARAELATLQSQGGGGLLGVGQAGPPADPARIEELNRTIETYQRIIEQTDGALREQLRTQAEAIELDRQYEEVKRDLIEALAEEGIYTNLSRDAINELMDEIFGGINATKQITESFEKLGAEFANLEGGALTADGAIQQVIRSILEGTLDPETQIANLAQTMVFLQQAGLGSAAVMAVLDAAIAGVATRAGIGAAEIARITANASVLNTLVGVPEAIANGMAQVETTARGAGGAVKTLADRFKELTDSIFAPVNAARDAAESIADLGEAYAEMGDGAFFASNEIQDAVSNILSSSNSASEGVANLNALYNLLARTVGSTTAPSLAFLRNTIDQVARSFGVAANTVAGATINLDFFNAGIRNAQKEVRTLSDYAGDLEEVISRAFDLRFARTFEIDRIAEAWEDLGASIEDARFELDELIASQQDLGSDRALKEYFLSIAEAYNDTLRAAQLRKEIAQLDREQADNAREIARAQAVSGGVLEGQGPGQRQNREALLDLVRNYQDYITTLAETGASQSELQAATEQARQEFIQQATELGFQESVVLQYAAAFDDVTTAINRVPRNITVEFNANPALQALNELNAKLNDSIDLAKMLNQVMGTPTPTRPTGPGTPTGTPTRPLSLSDFSRPTATRPLSVSDFSRPAQTIGNAITGVIIGGVNAVVGATRRLLNYSSGGFTGRGGMYEPAGIVHRGEYVIPKQFVNQSTGMPDPAFLAQLQNGMRSFANGGFVGGGGMAPGDAVMVELSPYDRKLLENAGNVQLRLNGRVVAEATNNSNFNQARRGSD